MPQVSERRLVLIVAAVQFINVLDFVMVMPLGPDFAAALGIPLSQIGVIGGSYTLAAAVSGVLGSMFLDRFDRRSALGVAMLGLVLSTALAGLATGAASLIAARVLAGMFGGPATSVALAAISDIVPKERRGRAMGTVMAAFSVASVLGVPAGLELARLYGWRAPFFAVAGLGVVVAGLALRALPALRGHLQQRASAVAVGARQLARRAIADLFGTFSEPLSRLALLVYFTVSFGVFLVVPNISSFLQFNLHYPREHLGILYLVGGAASFAGMRVTGIGVDRFGTTPFVLLGTCLHITALWTGFISPAAGLPVIVVFAVFMLSSSIRMVPTSSLSTRVPRPERRASFMSAQSAVGHTGSALGAMLGSALLVAEPSGVLQHMNWVASLAAMIALLMLWLSSRLERGVLRREGLPADAVA